MKGTVRLTRETKEVSTRWKTIIFAIMYGMTPFIVINFPALIGVAVAGAAVSIAEVVQDVGIASLVEAEAF